MKKVTRRACPHCRQPVRLAHIGVSVRWVHMSQIAGKACRLRRWAAEDAAAERARERAAGGAQ